MYTGSGDVINMVTEDVLEEGTVWEDAVDPCPAFSSLHGESGQFFITLFRQSFMKWARIKRMQWEFHSKDLALQNIKIAKTVMSLPVILEEI
jgi:hypothetical protein